MTATAARARPLLPALALIALFAGCTSGEAPPERPNLVLIIGDDHGYPDFGFMGSPVVKTPRLDALAEQGVVFTHGYSTASVCQPALFTLLTGLQPLQVELRKREFETRVSAREPERGIIDGMATLPRLLRERGYATFQSGKYWERHYAFAGFEEGTVEHPVWHGGIQQAGRLVRQGLEPEFAFIERNAERPFFLWFAPVLPHLPHDAPERYQNLYPNVSQSKRRYYANISWLDDGVGRLVDRVRELGLERRTLFVYVADNGWDTQPAESSAVGLLGGPRGKLSLHELGLRTPVLLSWHGGVEPGPLRDELVSLTDVFATLLDYAGATLPGDRMGHSLRPLLEGRGEWPRRELTGWMPSLRGEKEPYDITTGGFFWRDRRWHYLQPTRATPALYDLVADPTERTDVKERHPEVVERARRQINLWSRRVSEGSPAS